MSPMTDVYMSSEDPDSHISFHARPDCKFLINGMRSHDVEGWDPNNVPVHRKQLEDLPETHRRPCRACYPGQPKVTVTRARCMECNPTRLTPCIHNGGVLVEMEQKGGWGVGPFGRTYDESIITLRRKHVWPEHAYRYRLVESRARG